MQSTAKHKNKLLWEQITDTCFHMQMHQSPEGRQKSYTGKEENILKSQSPFYFVTSLSSQTVFVPLLLRQTILSCTDSAGIT